MQVFIWPKEHSIWERFFCFVALDAKATLTHVCITGALGPRLGPEAWAPETAASSTGKV